MTAVERLPHGYTNLTRRVGDRIEKRYEGADGIVRAKREFTSLTGLAVAIPCLKSFSSTLLCPCFSSGKSSAVMDKNS